VHDVKFYNRLYWLQTHPCIRLHNVIFSQKQHGWYDEQSNSSALSGNQLNLAMQLSWTANHADDPLNVATVDLDGRSMTERSNMVKLIWRPYNLLLFQRSQARAMPQIMTIADQCEFALWISFHCAADLGISIPTKCVVLCFIFTHFFEFS